MKINSNLHRSIAIFLCSLSLPLFASGLDSFKENNAWAVASAVSAVGKKFQITKETAQDAGIIYSIPDAGQTKPLTHKLYLDDAIIDVDFLLAQEGTALVYLEGRYAIPLANKNNEWQHLSLRFRAARFDQAGNKLQNALLLNMDINDEPAVINGQQQKNIVFSGLSHGAPINWEDQSGNLVFATDKGPFAIRNLHIRPADFKAIIPPAMSGSDTNEKELIDLVSLGKETFESVGCSVCHSIQADKSAVSTGPNLYGLFMRTPRTRDIVEGGENHRFSIKADAAYLHRSIRTPTEQLAIAEQGSNKGDAYPPLMPPFSAQVVSDLQIDAIGAYLATNNDPNNQGPAIKLVSKGEQQVYDPVKDDLQLLVDNKTRVQRGPMEGLSGRAIHVGQANGVNYSFDPRLLAIAKIWQGGFLDMTGEFLNRGGKGLKTGFESREIDFGQHESLLAPLNAKGNAVDFSFKDAKFGDSKTARESLNSTQDHLARLAQEDAQFLGYDLNSKTPQATPVFRYRVGKNTLALQTTISNTGDTTIEFSGELKTAQTFSINDQVLQAAKITKGELQNHQWTLAAGTKKASLTAKILLAEHSWHAPASSFDYRQQPLKITPATANLPAGYSVENYYAPKDNYGRPQLFEALGLAVAQDGTIVVATRTAGIWRIVKGQWQLFAEGTFDSLGVLIEDKKGLHIVVGQKAELTRISDTNGDGLADSYQTLFDAHSYHGNYHAYMHGPVKGGDGAYYININLVDDGSAYKAKGAYMGTLGGYNGWNFRVQPDGSFTPWANGLRSPAGLGTAPDGRVWYSENQGEYVGTSKIFALKQNGFYGHPAGLVDLPGMTPDSPEIAWPNVADKRERPIILLPHNKVANSPGNLVWDTTNGKFGAFANQLLVGDQTQSNLLRINTEIVNGIEQGSVMPFMDGLESGVMRPVFLPDGSLLLGQTGRGWSAKGGHVASLQRITWDGKTVVPAIHSLHANKTGFDIQLTQPLDAKVDATELQKLLAVESWVYRDAPDYGSDEMGYAKESITNISISNDRKQITIELALLEHPSVHPQQTARVYHVEMNNQHLFSGVAAPRLNAYYTLQTFAH